MIREQLVRFIKEYYSTDEEYPWRDEPNYAVFRHKGNRKWFALIMDIPSSRLGIPGKGRMDILNVKCDPLLISSLKAEKGVYPAYHMNKEHWASLALNEAEDELIKWLLDMSYSLTVPKSKKAKNKQSDKNRI